MIMVDTQWVFPLCPDAYPFSQDAVPTPAIQETGKKRTEKTRHHVYRGLDKLGLNLYVDGLVTDLPSRIALRPT